jgi:hypothetical protein
VASVGQVGGRLICNIKPYFSQPPEPCGNMTGD